MLTANLMGRLGNQMFQIAATYSLAIDNNDVCMFPLISNGTSPQSHEQLFYLETILSRVTYGHDFSWIRNVYEEKSFVYKKIPYAPDLALNGYFQSENYFSENMNFIRNLFCPTKYVEDKLEKYKSFFNKKNVAIHIRRGDYVKLSDHHTNLAEESNYYHIAMSKFPDCKFVFFSDDIEWCKKKFGSEHCFISNEKDVVEMYIFSKIPNKIIANSTFSWWGAWLDENPNLIISPQEWFGHKNANLLTKTLIPEAWIVL